jgi:hypothetical protein
VNDPDHELVGLTKQVVVYSTVVKVITLPALVYVVVENAVEMV